MSLAESAPPAIGRVRRAIMTWTSGVVSTAVTLVVGLVATPKIIVLIGESRFGAFRAVTDWMGYLSLADVGLGTAFGVLMMRAHVAGPGHAAAMARHAMRVLMRVSAVAIPSGIALAWFMPSLIRDGTGMAWELRVSSVIIAGGLVFGPLLVLRSSLEASQRGYLVNAALLAQSLIVTALSVLLAAWGFGLVGQSIAVLTGLAVFVVVTLRWAWPTLTVPGPSQAAPPVRARELWSLSWPLAIAGAGNRLNLMTDTIVVGKLLGTSEVAMLFLTQRVILLCAGQVNSLANASWAALAELRQSGQTADFEARLAELTRLIVGVGLVLGGTVAALNAHFVRLWVGPHLYGGDLLSGATLASAVTFGFLLPYSWAIDMAGDTRARLKVSTIGAVLNLGLSVVFVRRFGVAGVALGTLCAYLLTDAWYCPWLVCRRYSVRPAVIRAAVGGALLRGGPWLAGVWTLSRLAPAPEGWTALLAQGALAGGLALIYCWMAVFSPHDRLEWSRRLGFSRA